MTPVYCDHGRIHTSSVLDTDLQQHSKPWSLFFNLDKMTWIGCITHDSSTTDVEVHCEANRQSGNLMKCDCYFYTIRGFSWRCRMAEWRIHHLNLHLSRWVTLAFPTSSIVFQSLRRIKKVNIHLPKMQTY